MQASLLFRRLSLLLIAAIIATLSPPALMPVPAATASSGNANVALRPAAAPLPAIIPAPRGLPPAAFVPAPMRSGALLPPQAPSSQSTQAPETAADALLSQGMRATASASPSSLGQPSNANDDSLLSGWLYYKGFPNGVDYPQWWQVDLGAVYQLSRVIVHLDQQFGECGSSHAYTIEASTNNQAFALIASSNENASGRDTYSVTGSGRYIRITFTGGYDPCGTEEGVVSGGLRGE